MTHDLSQTVLSALFMSALMPILHIAFKRGSGRDDITFLLMNVAFAVYVAAWLLVEFVFFTPPAQTSAALIAGLATAFAAFLFYSECFALLSRGFTLRLLIDLDAAGEMNVDEFIGGYAGGRGLEWLMRKRMEGVLLRMKMVTVQGDLVKLTPLGKAISGICLLVKKTLRMGPGG